MNPINTLIYISLKSILILSSLGLPVVSSLQAIQPETSNMFQNSGCPLERASSSCARHHSAQMKQSAYNEPSYKQPQYRLVMITLHPLVMITIIHTFLPTGDDI
jgi:hypothetical protein